MLRRAVQREAALLRQQLTASAQQGAPAGLDRWSALPHCRCRALAG